MDSMKKVLFLGGSITAGASASSYDLSWPRLCFAGISGPLFDDNCRMYNASISGTGSFLAVMRLGQHVLPYAPDMVFIEFSVNDIDHGAEDPQLVISSLDYIIQTLIKQNPRVVIVFAYTTFSGKNASHIHSQVAKHYGIPELDFQSPMAEDLRKNGWGWDRYLADGVHPNDLGHRFYADIAVKTILSDPDRFRTPTRHEEGMAEYYFQDPRIVPVSEELKYTGFTFGPVEDDTHIKHLPELEVTHALTAYEPGAVLKVPFYGTHFGLYHRIFSNYGCAAISIDGEQKGIIDCYHRYRPAYQSTGEFVSFFKCNNLPEGEHIAEITVLNEKNKNSTGNQITIAGFLLG